MKIGVYFTLEIAFLLNEFIFVLNLIFTGGLVTLPGAKPALGPTPGMIGYGMAKAAVHQLTKSLSTSDGGLPTGSLAVALLPVTLDTPMNRKWMPKADTSTWTPLEFVAELVFFC